MVNLEVFFFKIFIFLFNKVFLNFSLHNFFFKKISPKYYCDMIIDDLDKDNTPIRFNGLKKYFNIIFVSNNIHLKIQKLQFFKISWMLKKYFLH